MKSLINYRIQPQVLMSLQPTPGCPWVTKTEKEKRIKQFKGYTVDKTLMNAAKPDAIFLHCLPAYYGYEVTKDVAHGPQSVIFDEAENRMWAQIGIMVKFYRDMFP